MYRDPEKQQKNEDFFAPPIATVLSLPPTKTLQIVVALSVKDVEFLGLVWRKCGALIFINTLELEGRETLS